MRNLLKKIALITLLLPLVAQAWSINKVVVFGDSLSDSGNLFDVALSANLFNQPTEVAPTKSGYFDGRFSNGPVWSEYFAKSLGYTTTGSLVWSKFLAASPQTSFNNYLSYTNENPHFRNYAFGGSWTEGADVSHIQFPPSLTDQVNLYKLFNSNADLSNVLFTFWSGSNDYLQDINSNGDENFPEQITSNTVSIINVQIRSLIAMGGNYFVIFNLPDLGNIPLAQFAGGPENYPSYLTQLSQMHNAKLATMVAQLREDYPQKQFVEIDIFSLLHGLQSTGTINSIHLNNVSIPCYAGGITAPMIPVSTIEDRSRVVSHLYDDNAAYLQSAGLPLLTGEQAHNSWNFTGNTGQNPDDSLFWDLLHPTTKVHEEIAKIVLSQIEAAGFQH